MITGSARGGLCLLLGHEPSSGRPKICTKGPERVEGDARQDALDRLDQLVSEATQAVVDALARPART